jgi:hypothetical protein
MFRKIMSAAALASMTVVGAAGITAPAQARHWHGDGGGWGHHGGGYYGGGHHYYGGRGYYGRGGYYRGGYYGHCHSGGGTGAIVGALAGGLAGNAIAGPGDRTTGTIIGAGGGALLGHAIGRHRTRC